MEPLLNYIKLMRPKHYIKNVLVFVPCFFNRNLFNTDKTQKAIVGFVCFCLVSSAVYIINDIKDVEKDKKHTTKKNRPIASGKVSIKMACILMVLCLLISGVLSFICTPFSLAFLGLYFLMNAAYSLALKNKPIIDVVILAFGFVLRVLYGGAVTGVEVSRWLYLVIVFGSLYMGLGKRRNELMQQNDTREVLKHYNQAFLDKNMYVSMALVIVFYALWTLEFDIPAIQWTVPYVAVIFFRYSFDVEGENDGDPVEVLLHDKILIFMALAYIVFIVSLLYFF